MAFLNTSMKVNINSTPVPNIFIDDYMAAANPAYAIIYIYVYRHSFNSDSQLTTLDISKVLNLLESDVVNAWRYWEKQGLVTMHEDEDNFSIEFLPIPVSGKSAPASKVKPVVMLECKPQYTPDELEIYKQQSQEIAGIFSLAEQTMGKLLNYNDLNTLFGFYDWLRLPVEIIEELIKYCGENEGRNMRYIEKVAIDWAENGIDTLEKAHEHIRIFNKDYNEILKAFGLSGRRPAPSEIKHMKKWLKEFEMPLELVLDACEKTIEGIGQPKFSYAGKILEKWHEMGIKTLEQVKSLDDSFYKEKESKKKQNESSAKQPVTKKNRFVNYKQRENDYQKLEKLELEYLQQRLKG